jgi:hypothetical protein
MMQEENLSLEINSNKPIKKRVLDDMGDDEDIGDRSFASEDAMNEEESEVSSYETKARKDLIEFLTNKGVDVSRVHDYQIHIQITKKRKSHSGTGNFSVTYTGPDGAILTSKTDVLDSIKKLAKYSNISRDDIYNASKTVYNEINENLPVEVDGIQVINFGVINYDNNSTFTAVDIFPIGYKAELRIPPTTAFRGRSNVRPLQVECEVVERDDLPEFRVTVLNTGQSYWASSEASVWKKYDPLSEMDVMPSFFNLQIELYIEGMTVADCCELCIHIEIQIFIYMYVSTFMIAYIYI